MFYNYKFKFIERRIDFYEIMEPITYIFHSYSRHNNKHHTYDVSNNNDRHIMK